MAAVARRYARAFAEVVVERRMNADQMVQDLTAFAELVSSSAELRNVLQNPAVSHEQKLKLLNAITTRIGASKELRNFVAVLVDHHRLGQIHDVAEQFKQELNDRLGIAETVVNSARELTQEEKQALERQLAQVTGKKVRASYSRDAGLLGGVMVRVGSTIYDGSVRGQLRRIRDQIAGS